MWRLNLFLKSISLISSQFCLSRTRSSSSLLYWYTISHLIHLLFRKLTLNSTLWDWGKGTFIWLPAWGCVCCCCCCCCCCCACCWRKAACAAWAAWAFCSYWLGSTPKSVSIIVEFSYYRAIVKKGLQAHWTHRQKRLESSFVQKDWGVDGPVSYRVLNFSSLYYPPLLC